MKVRRICWILVLLLAVCLLMLPILAQDPIYFTAINNTLLELDDRTMPVKDNGTMYLPCSVFNSSELGIYCLYSKNKQLVMLSDLDKTLYFDMSTGKSYDDEDVYPYAAIYHNETAYLPVFFTADYFDVEFSYIRNDYAPIIRLKKGSVLSDSDFLRGAAAIMETRLSQYRSSRSPDETASPSSSPSAVPVTPQPTATPVPTLPPRPSRSGVEVYIALLGLSSNSEACADQLRAKGYTPCFFVGAEDVRQYPEVIRKLRGTGCGIGVLFASDLQEEYEQTAALLREAAKTVTFITASAGPLSPEDRQAAENTGLIIWCTQEPEDDVDRLIDELNAAEKRYDIVLDGGISVNRVTRIANYLRSESYTVKEITEFSETAKLTIETERVGD